MSKLGIDFEVEMRLGNVVWSVLPLPFNLTSQLLHLPCLHLKGMITPAFFATFSIKSPCSATMFFPDGSKDTSTGFEACSDHFLLELSGNLNGFTSNIALFEYIELRAKVDNNNVIIKNITKKAIPNFLLTACFLFCK